MYGENYGQFCKQFEFLSEITEKCVTKQPNCQFYHLTKLKTTNKEITN